MVSKVNWRCAGVPLHTSPLSVWGSLPRSELLQITAVVLL